ncbi:transcription elongation factor GreA [Candidatus Kaiserbacteria bacterium]|nr:MAG: transcription elongation factor GreA [Candidatus Kaiserbacteria bacterium]PCI90577.1 MAG: transcription elongation factor GreA [Candidatus Kaiserbacteria bacterium]
MNQEQENDNLLTQEKFEELTNELSHLKTTRRREIAEQLEYARSLGDLSENAEYQEARELQGATEGRIKQLESILTQAEVIDKEASAHEVHVGSKVTIIKQGEKEEREYEVVGSVEANMRDRKISHMSPLGMAMVGKKKGDEFEFDTPNGSVKYKIGSIS